MKISTIINNFIPSGTSATGVGDIDTDVTDQVGFLLTTAAVAAYTAPATAGKRYVVKSIHVTNIGAASAEVSAEINGTGVASISLANKIPVPAGASIELLKRIKVLHPSDAIRLLASAAATLHAVITVAAYDNTTMFRAGVDLTSTTITDLYVATANTAIESIMISNDIGTANSKIAVIWTDGANAAQGYYAYDMVIPGGSTVELLDGPKRIPTGHKIRVQAGDSNRLEVIISGQTL